MNESIKLSENLLKEVKENEDIILCGTIKGDEIIVEGATILGGGMTLNDIWEPMFSTKSIIIGVGIGLNFSSRMLNYI